MAIVKSIAVVGGGICGSVLAFYARKFGHKISIYQPDNIIENCSFMAAGMLAPMSELESSERSIYEYGLKSLTLWPLLIQQLKAQVFFRDTGTLVVSHWQDDAVFFQFEKILKLKLKEDYSEFCELQTDNRLEKELESVSKCLWLKREAQLDNRQLLKGLHNWLFDHANWIKTQATSVSAFQVDSQQYDWVFDCRGLAAKDTVAGLHGVRGEMIRVHAPDVSIKHMVRVMHPRYKIYIVPRENQQYLIGATEIASEDASAVSVRSTLELLSAAFSIHRGFAEARILEMRSHVRPTTLDHQPYININNGLTKVNGLYRHGYLLAPAIAVQALTDSGLYEGFQGVCYGN